MAMNGNEGGSAYPPNPDVKSGSCLIAGLHIEDVRKDHPYLLGYLKVQDKMDFTDDIGLIELVGKQLVQDPHCPCSIIKSEKSICPCLACRTVQHCHCGMFVKKVPVVGELQYA